MIFKIFKNTFPALFIVWTIFFIELAAVDTKAEGDPSAYFYQQAKIFLCYSALGLIIGGLSAGILAKKKKKYSFFFENDFKKYSKYFLKNFSFSFLAIFSLVSRELINNPLMYKTTLLGESFWFSGLFGFIRDKFSPLYFSAFFLIIIVMSIHNLMTVLSIYHSTKRIIGYSSSIILSFILIFNYGFLNAAENREGKNIILIAVENLKHYQLNGKIIKDKPAIKELKAHSYDFINCFTPVKDPGTALISVLTSIHPDQGGYSDGLISFRLRDKTIFSLLAKNKYRTNDFSDRRFISGRDEGSERYPTNTEVMKSEVLLSHMLSPVIFNNRRFINKFPEVFLLDGYRDKSYVREEMSDMIKYDESSFMFLYTIPDLRDYPPFPYYRISPEDNENAYLNYIDDELSAIIGALKKHGKYESTVIGIFGLPPHSGSIKASEYKVPFFICSSEYKFERDVKNPYSTLDILPTVLDAADFKFTNTAFYGRSFFDPEFVKLDIAVADISVLKKQNRLLFENENGYFSKNPYIEKEVHPLIPRSLIRGDYKLNVIPSEMGIKYELYDIVKDADEKYDLYELNPAAAKKMTDIYEEKMKKEFKLKIISGYTFK